MNYNLQPRIETSTLQKIHRSRMIVFDGNEIPMRLRMRNSYWNDSVLTQTANAIMNYSTSHDAVAGMIQDFRVAVFRMKDLADKISEGQTKVVQQRLELVNISKSIINAVVIDADTEEFEHKTTAVTGVKELVEKVESRLASAADMPRTVLFGESPAGMGGTGRHEQDNFYDDVSSEQNIYLKPKHTSVIKLLAQTLGINSEKIELEYNPLYQLDDKQIAETRKINADADQAYIFAGVLDAREVAVSRFGGEKYGMDIQIDDSLKRDALVQNPYPPEKTPPSDTKGKDAKGKLGGK